MTMSVLKRALPFILTLLMGVTIGSALKRAERPERAAQPEAAEKSSCKMRRRQVMMMAPPPSYFESRVFTSGDVTLKAIINHKPEPLYTLGARRNNVEGAVRLRLVLAADRTVKDIVPIATLPDGLTEQAIEAARAIEFTPAVKDGRPVSQYATVEYNFNLY